MFFWEGQREHKVSPGGHDHAREGQFCGHKGLLRTFWGRSKGTPNCCWERDCDLSPPLPSPPPTHKHTHTHHPTSPPTNTHTPPHPTPLPLPPPPPPPSPSHTHPPVSFFFVDKWANLQKVINHVLVRLRCFFPLAW